MAGSESRADVAPKDESAGVVADLGAEGDKHTKAIRSLPNKLRLEASGGKDDGLAPPTYGGSTDAAVLLESGSDVDHDKPNGDMRIDAAVGAGFVVCRMQMVEEEVGGASDLRVETSQTSGALPPGGGAQQQLERELEKARLACAWQQLWEEGYSSEGGESDGCEGGADEMPSARASSCNGERQQVG